MSIWPPLFGNMIRRSPQQPQAVSKNLHSPKAESMDHLQHWRGAGGDIQFEPADFEVMELAMGIIPEIRICALILKWARNSGVQYPVKHVNELIHHFPHEKYSGGGHEITADSIRSFMANEYFPIADEGELLSRIYLTLMRCKMETGNLHQPKSSEQSA